MRHCRRTDILIFSLNKVGTCSEGFRMGTRRLAYSFWPEATKPH